jgi:hypothetical protein
MVATPPKTSRIHLRLVDFSNIHCVPIAKVHGFINTRPRVKLIAHFDNFPFVGLFFVRGTTNQGLLIVYTSQRIFHESYTMSTTLGIY